MRQARLGYVFAATALLVTLVFGCSSRGEEEERPSSTLAQSDSLKGLEVSESKNGPWTVRAFGAPSGRGASGGVSRGERMTLDAGAPVPVASPAEGGDYGGAPPPGSPAGPAKGDVPSTDAMSPEPAGSSAGEWEEDSPRNSQAGPLRAGSTDDNENFAEFIEFLASWSDKPAIAEQADILDVNGRTFIRVVNADGKPVPGARVQVVRESEDRVLSTATTYGDGRAPFYPRLAATVGTVPASMNAEGDLIVEVSRGDARERVRWDGEGDELTVKIDVARPVAEPIALDVVFVLDTTGSMSDEIERIKRSLLSVTKKLRALDREFSLRYGAVLYRDVGDEYVTMAHPFTEDIRAFDEALASVEANGGGDTPESMNQGVAEAVGRLSWRQGAAKVMFLIADAPPHMDYQGDVPYGDSLKAALADGIRIHSVAASGLDELGSLVFRQIAQFTRGKFIFIEYGTIEETAAGHGVAAKVKSNNLDDIIYEQISEEVARWGR